jgi:LPXTG-motif cell wall-anchored protein
MNTAQAPWGSYGTHNAHGSMHRTGSNYGAWGARAVIMSASEREAAEAKLGRRFGTAHDRINERYEYAVEGCNVKRLDGTFARPGLYDDCIEAAERQRELEFAQKRAREAGAPIKARQSRKAEKAAEEKRKKRARRRRRQAAADEGGGMGPVLLIGGVVLLGAGAWFFLRKKK